MPSTEPFAARVRRLVDDRKEDVEDVARAVANQATKGASRSTFLNGMKDPRKLNRAVLECAAAALEIDPDEFVEWRAIVISDALQLDDNNLDQIVANLRVIQAKPTARALAKLQAAPKRRTAAARRAREGAAAPQIRDLGRRRAGLGPAPSGEGEDAARDSGG
jgi:hypothetical protein